MINGNVPPLRRLRPFRLIAVCRHIGISIGITVVLQCCVTATARACYTTD